MGREGHCKRISLACVGSGCSLWITLGLPQPKAACASRVYTAHAPGGFVGALSQVDPVPHALPKSKPLRFSGTLQGHRPNWACILCLSQVRAAQATRCLVSALSQESHASLSPPRSWSLGFLGASPEHHFRCATCLLWGADLRLRCSWWMPTIQDPRKMWLATGRLLIVWWEMLSLGSRLQQPLALLLQLLHAGLSASRSGGRGLYTAG